jgi:hypothetical protein
VEWLKALGLSPSTPCPLKKKKIWPNIYTHTLKCPVLD